MINLKEIKTRINLQNDKDREIFINRVSSKSWMLKSKENAQSRKLCETLSEKQIKIAEKWVALDQYMSDENNKSESLYKLINDSMNEDCIEPLPHGKAAHRFHFFKEPVLENVKEGAILFAPLGVPISLIGGVIYGAYRAFTRKPLTIEEQTELCETLSRSKLLLPQENKANIINNILLSYKLDEANSNSSKELIKFLSKNDRSTEEKWQEIINYMVEKTSHYSTTDYLKNNGKKLYLLIKKELEEIMGKDNTDNHLESYGQ